MITVNFPPNISSLTAPGLTQYDTGQIISMTGTGITTETVQVHFAASGQSGAIVKTGTVLGGVITAEIPDSVLAMGRTITAWAYVIDGDARETRYTAVLPVVNRARPQDYISPAEPPYLTANELNDRIVTAETAVTELSDGLTDRYTKTETDGLLAGKANKQQEDWITPTLVNGWVARTDNVIKYRKDQLGKVTIQGQISSGSDVVMFTLPSGYRPSHTIVLPVVTSGGAIISIIVFTYGIVAINTGTAGTFVDLSPISFFVA